MDRNLKKFEVRKRQILRGLGKIGDMHRGTVYSQYRKCGKSCRCQEEGHPGHGPYFLLTYKDGKETRAIALNSKEKVEKAKREVENFRRFQELIKEYIAVSEAISHVRPVAVEREEDEGKKNSARKSKRSSRRK